MAGALARSLRSNTRYSANCRTDVKRCTRAGESGFARLPEGPGRLGPLTARH
jgi:hypothetical protein